MVLSYPGTIIGRCIRFNRSCYSLPKVSLFLINHCKTHNIMYQKISNVEKFMLKSNWLPLKPSQFNLGDNEYYYIENTNETLVKYNSEWLYFTDYKMFLESISDYKQKIVIMNNYYNHNYKYREDFTHFTQELIDTRIEEMLNALGIYINIQDINDEGIYDIERGIIKYGKRKFYFDYYYHLLLFMIEYSKREKLDIEYHIHEKLFVPNIKVLSYKQDGIACQSYQKSLKTMLIFDEDHEDEEWDLDLLMLIQIHKVDIFKPKKG